MAKKNARDLSDTDQTPFPAAGVLNHVLQAPRVRVRVKVRVRARRFLQSVAFKRQN